MNMNGTANITTKLHPLLWIAGISVTLLSFVGIASMTGVLAPAAGSAGLAAVSAESTTQATADVLSPAGAAQESVSKPSASIPSTTAISNKPKPKSRPQLAPVPVAVATQHPAAEKKIADALQPSQAVLLPPPHGSGVPPDYVEPLPFAAASPIRACPECGVIEDVRQVVHDGQGSGLGAIAGGVLGGALGSNLGKGHGRTLASLAAAIGGGMIGNQIEKSRNQTIGYQVGLRMEDGTRRSIEMPSVPSWRIGDAVRLVNGSIVSTMP